MTQLIRQEVQVEAPENAGDQPLKVEVYRRNLNQEHEKCPACKKGLDILVIAVDGVEVFFFCNCGHPWTMLSECAD